MRLSGVSGTAASALIIVLLQACGPSSSAGVPAMSHAALRAPRSALLYASNGSAVDVFNYPSGGKTGELGGFDSGFDRQGLCADAAGDLFVTGTLNGSGQVYEFAPGSGNPSAKLTTQGYADSCSVDPTTGNLAVAEYYYPVFGHGEVAIFANAQGNPTYYSDPNAQRFTDCTYDDSGNLFISIYRAGELLELPAGSQSFQTIALNQNGTFSGSLQWYRGKLIVASWNTDNSPEDIERVQISNGTAKILGITVLNTGHDKRSVGQFAVDGANIVGPNENDKYLAMWKYPAGGPSVKNLGRGYGHWRGTVIVP